MNRQQRRAQARRSDMVRGPSLVAAFFEKGFSRHREGRFAEAEAHYRTALRADPKHVPSLDMLGMALYQQGRVQEALAPLRLAVSHACGAADPYGHLGVVLLALGHAAEAGDAAAEAVRLAPNDPVHFYNLGLARLAEGHYAEAVEAYRAVTSFAPNNVEAHANLGAALRGAGVLDGAVQAYERALTLSPRDADVLSNLGNVLQALGRFAEAIEHYRAALAAAPDHRDAVVNLGAALQDLGRMDEGIAMLEHAVVRWPDYALAHWNLALALLSTGEFRRGWLESEWRTRLPGGSLPHDDQYPRWRGEPLVGRTLLVFSEQGFGDVIQFARLLKLLPKDGRVVFECYPQLKRVTAAIVPEIEVLATGEPMPQIDVACPLLSLPGTLGIDFGTIPFADGYLKADSAATKKWRDRLGIRSERAGRPLRVGLVWAGGARPEQPRAFEIDRRRSLALTQLAPLLEIDGIDFVSLQAGPPAAELAASPFAARILDPMAEMTDFADTAALASVLDLVITVDTSMAHLAGALGVPVWMMSRFDACWRWLLNRTDSPWYRSMQVFRQPAPGDWASVISTVTEVLAAMRDAPPDSVSSGA
jgi:tetratricopeptide (TPR) repeat protein